MKVRLSQPPYRAIGAALQAASLTLWLLCLPPARSDSGNQADLDQLVESAELLTAQRKLVEAELVWRNALSLVTTRFGSFHPVTAGINKRIASFLIDQNRLSDAERHLQKALVIASGYNPAAALDGEFRGVNVFTNNALQNPDSLPGNFELADVLEGYASLYSKQNRYSDAERLLKTSARIYDGGADNKAAAGYLLRTDSHENHIRTILELANVQSRQSKFVEAEETFQKAITITKKRKGDNAPELVRVLHSLSSFYREQGRNSDAESTDSEAASLLR
ncbi:MAG: tetratricopeptide repeat protein [Candidatus Obscuribacterales bacterium]|nr:tetratricopeptide repeat protein [Candidatus Obscuribacterales bacterium]